MENWNWCIYLCVSIVLLLPILVAPKNDDTRNEFIREKGKHFAERTQARMHTLAGTQRIFIEFELLFENIVDIVATNIPKINRELEIFLMKMINRTIDTLNVFSDKTFNEGEYLLNEMLSNLKRQIESLSSEFQNLAISVEHFNWAVTQLNQTLINNTDVYDWWTAHIKQKLRSVNNTELYQYGCKAIDDFIKKSAKELHNCCRITIEPMISLCKSAGSVITEALHIFVSAIDRIQACLEDKNSYFEYLLPCIHLAYDGISSLLSRVVQIIHQMNNMLPIKVIYTRKCFAIVIVDMKSKRDIESNLFSN